MFNYMKKLILLVTGIMVMLSSVCLAHWYPESEMVLGGIGYGCTMGYVRSIYGEPKEKKWFNNDGFRGVRYVYSSHFSVTARVKDDNPLTEDNLPVTNVNSTDMSISTPGGITVGIPYSTVSGQYGKGEAKKYTTKRNFYYYLLAGTNRSMSFYVNDKGLISQIIYSEEW